MTEPTRTKSKALSCRQMGLALTGVVALEPLHEALVVEGVAAWHDLGLALGGKVLVANQAHGPLLPDSLDIKIESRLPARSRRAAAHPHGGEDGGKRGGISLSLPLRYPR